MIVIKSNELLNILHSCQKHRKNQGVYAVEFFNAAGSSYFELPADKTHWTNAYLEAERRYVIDRPLIPEIKNDFPKPINLSDLASYIEENLKPEKLPICMTEIGIPADAQLDVKKFSMALAMQFSRFVESENDDVDNAVWDIYQALLNGEEVNPENFRGPRYPGDDVLVPLEGRHYGANCYEIIHHEWDLQNKGSQEWHGRRLVLVNGDKIGPRPEQTSIPIPDTKPGAHTRVATDIDARGREGNFNCCWEMQDADGENCFPNKRWDFNITIHVTFHASN